jgi:hypothetical protein
MISTPQTTKKEICQHRSLRLDVTPEMVANENHPALPLRENFNLSSQPSFMQLLDSYATARNTDSCN